MRMALIWLTRKGRFLRCYRLELWSLVAVGLLGLCYWIYHNDELWLSMTPEQDTTPQPQGVPRSTPPTPAPCLANTSMHKIHGFDTLPGHMQDFMRYQHCRVFPALLSAPDKCGGPQGSTNVFLLLAIKSSPLNYERREVIRKTWGQERTFEGALIRRVFLMGVTANARDDKKLNPLLRWEQQEHGDMLQWAFKDTFFNLTLKQVLFYTWLEEHCPGVHFIFNGDDDVFVNTDNVIRFAKTSPGGKEHLVVGQLLINSPLIRNPGSKYFVPTQLMASEVYPPYCSGGGMLMSGFTAHVIARESQHIKLIPIDDAYLGMCLQKAGLKPASHSGIRTFGVGVPANTDPFDPCYYRELLLVHRFVPFEVAAMWEAIHDPHLNCGKKVSIF